MIVYIIHAIEALAVFLVFLAAFKVYKYYSISESENFQINSYSDDSKIEVEPVTEETKIVEKKHSAALGDYIGDFF